MPELVSMTLCQVEAKYPALASAVACIRPYMKVFVETDVAVYPTGKSFQVESCLPFPELLPATQMWSATLSADKAWVQGYENRGWAWVSTASQSFSLEQFADILRKVSKARTKKRNNRMG